MITTHLLPKFDCSFYSLTVLQVKDVFSRDEELYRKRHYRAHWQPLCAIFGLFGCSMIVVFSGWPAIYLLSRYDVLKPDHSIKPVQSLVGDLVGAYLGVNIPCAPQLVIIRWLTTFFTQPVLFIILFFIYKFIYGTRFRRLCDFENAYFLPNFDREPLATRPHGTREWLKGIWSFTK